MLSIANNESGYPIHNENIDHWILPIFVPSFLPMEDNNVICFRFFPNKEFSQ